MKISERNQFEESLKESGYHVLTLAETGFAMLNIYGEQFGLTPGAIEAFSEKVNKNNESGSLHPKAPISAVPRHFIRDDNDSNTLREQIIDFLKANQEQIKATRVLFDFRAGVAQFVIDACNQALKSEYAQNLKEVVIINDK